MKSWIVTFLFLIGCGTGSATKSLAEAITPCFRAEAALVQTLSDIDDLKQTGAKSQDEVNAWRKKYDEMMTSLQVFHAALSTVAAILLTGKP